MFRTLNYINEVFKERSFTRAAQKLYVSQSSMSLTVKMFEQKIGIQIFDRSTTPIQLTEAGKVYMEGIQRILSIEKELKEYLDDYKELKTGSLTLGAPHMFSCYLLPALIAQFEKRCPLVEIQLVDADFLTLHNMVLNGEVDILIESNQFDESQFQAYPLFLEKILLAVPNSDPVNEQLKAYSLSLEDIRSDLHINPDRPCITLRNFQEHCFLLIKKGNDIHSRAMDLFRNSGFEPQISLVVNQMTTVYSMVNHQLGVAFVTDTIVKLSDSGENVVFYKLDGELTTRYIYLAHKLKRYVSRAMSEFILMMKAISVAGMTTVTSKKQ